MIGCLGSVDIPRAHHPPNPACAWLHKKERRGDAGTEISRTDYGRETAERAVNHRFA